MARLVSLQTMQARVLQRAAMQFASATAALGASSPAQFQGELTDSIVEGIAKLYGLFSRVDGQPYYLSSVPFATNSTTDTYRLQQEIPVSDFMKLRGIDVNFGQNIVQTARSFMWHERNRYKWLGGWVYTQPLAYRMIGNAIKLMPNPGGVFQCMLWYTPAPPVLMQPGDTFDGINGFEEYAILDAAIKLLVRQERLEHAQVLMQMQEAEKQRILTEADNRDAEEPERIQDVTGPMGVVDGYGFGF
jgi:hypothetical protein